MSLLGLSLAIGILIDDAIVVRENIVRHVEMGKDHFTAAHDGTDEIGLAVAATTFSILAVFIPVAFLTGVGPVVQAVRAHHRLLGAGVALGLVLARPDALGLLARSARGAGEAGVDHPGARPVQCLVQPARDRYKGVIAWALDHRAAMVVVALSALVGAYALQDRGMLAFGAVVLGAFVIVLALSGSRPVLVRIGGALVGLLVMAGMKVVPEWYKVGVGFFPLDDRSEFNIAIETPPGSNLEYTSGQAPRLSPIARAARGRATATPRWAVPRRRGGRGHIRASSRRRTSGDLEPGDRRRDPARARAASAGVKLAVRDSDWGGGRKLLMLADAGPDVASLNRVAEQVAPK